MGPEHAALDATLSVAVLEAPLSAVTLKDASREFVAEHRWLWFRIKSGATHRQVRILVDGHQERSFGAK